MPVHPNSLKNLRPPFEPGNNMNPGGRPKGSSVLAPILRKLAANPNTEGEGELAERYADRILKGAERLASGEMTRNELIDLSAAFKILDRTDPEVKESKLHVSSNGEVPYGEDE